jgi:TonB family protein
MPCTVRGSLTVAALGLFLGAGAAALRAQAAPVGAGEPYRVGEKVTRPEKISGAAPVYTEIARKARVVGIVIVEAIIDEQGNVTNAKVVKGLPMGLSESAVDAIQTWKFKPATFEGRPVKVYYTLTVNFQVDSTPRFGPRFRSFVATHPDFAAALQANRYQEALALLARAAVERPGDSEIPLARCYVLLLEGRLEDGWQEALAYHRSDPYEILQIVGLFAWSKLKPDMAVEESAKVVEMGIQAETMAIAANAGSLEALVYKGLFLREKMKLTTDGQERQRLFDEANELEKQAMDLQAKAKAAGIGPEVLSPVTGLGRKE